MCELKSKDTDNNFVLLVLAHFLPSHLISTSRQESAVVQSTQLSSSPKAFFFFIIEVVSANALRTRHKGSVETTLSFHLIFLVKKVWRRGIQLDSIQKPFSIIIKAV